MTPLEKSIEKWKRNAVAKTPNDAHIYEDTCALCHEHQDCQGCPVAEKTGEDYCSSSPWEKAWVEFKDWEYLFFRLGPSRSANNAKRRFRRAALKEVAFLESLLPEKSA